MRDVEQSHILRLSDREAMTVAEDARKGEVHESEDAYGCARPDQFHQPAQISRARAAGGDLAVLEGDIGHPVHPARGIDDVAGLEKKILAHAVLRISGGASPGRTR